MRTRTNRWLGSALLAGLATIAAVAAPARADVVDLAAAADTTLYEDPAGSLGNGAGAHVFAGTSNDDLERRALLRFDLSGIPPGAVVTAVELQLQMSRTRGPATDVRIHRLLAGWGEGASDAGGEEGSGAPAAPGDATWIHTSFPSGTWAVPGGDLAAAASASTPVGDVSRYTWASTPALVADVQDWLDGIAPNHGWILIGATGPRTAKRFDSRTNPVAANRPLLRVTYTVPSPGGACCEATGACTVVADAAACAGTFQGAGTACGAGGVCGACCDGPSCRYAVAAACPAYAGDGSSCSPSPCSVPTPGACCRPDGTCAAAADAAACAGAFQGAGTACGAGGTCGACCAGGSCSLRIAATCAGVYQGDGASCAPSPCAARPSGACCTSTGCVDGTTEAGCRALGGRYTGTGQSCSTDPCGRDSRACCFGGGATCTVMDRDVCDAMGGDRQGGGSVCATNPCAERGACCLPGSCLDDVHDDDCENMGGLFLGALACGATTCGDDRACCLATGCQVMDMVACEALGGAAEPRGVACAGASCGPAPGCDVARIAPIARLLAVKANASRDVALAWSPDPAASEYNTWTVTAKDRIPVANASLPATSVPGCLGRVAADCVHAGAVPPAAGMLLFYNVIGACSGVEAAE